MGSVKHVLVVWLMCSCILTLVMVKGCICQFGKQFKRINENQTDGICKKIPNSDIVVCERHLLIYLVCESPSPEEIKKAMEATLEQDLEYTSIVEILMTHSNITEITLEIFNFNRLAGTKILNLSDNRISKLPEDLFNSSIFWTLEELLRHFLRKSTRACTRWSSDLLETLHTFTTVYYQENLQISASYSQ